MDSGCDHASATRPAGAPGDQDATGDPGGVASGTDRARDRRPGGQGGGGREHVGEGEHPGGSHGARRGAERRPQRLGVPVDELGAAGVHPAGGQVGAVGDVGPSAHGLDCAGHRDVLEDLVADRRVATRSLVCRGCDRQDLSVGGGEGGPRGVLGHAQRQGRHPRPLQQRLDQPFGDGDRDLAWVGAGQVEAGVPHQPGDAAHRVWSQDDVRVDEQQQVRGGVVGEGCLGQAMAGPRLAQPSLRWVLAAAVEHLEPGVLGHRGAHEVAGAIGRAVVEHDHAQGGMVLRQQPCQARLDPVGLVARGQQDGHADLLHRITWRHDGCGSQVAGVPRGVGGEPGGQDRGGQDGRASGSHRVPTTAWSGACRSSGTTRRAHGITVMPMAIAPQTATAGRPKNTAAAITLEA